MNTTEHSTIQQIVTQRQIQHLFHFTPLDNLDSILSNGLCSRSYLHQKGTHGVYLDNVRADGKLDFISLSVSFPNYRMFYTRRKNDERITWAVISLSPSLLWEITDREIQFFDTNAAYQKFRDVSDESLQSADAFASLFADSITNKDGQLARDNRLLPKDPTDVQAEIMVERHIETRYIGKIFLNNQTMVNELSQQYPNFEFALAPQLFNQREYSRQNGWRT